MNFLHPTLGLRTNTILVLVGAAIMCIGLFGIKPLVFNLKFLKVIGPIILVSLVMMCFVFRATGMHGMKEGGLETLKSASSFFLIMVGFFLAMGFGTVLMKIKAEQIEGSLVKYHFFGAFLASVAMPSSTSASTIVTNLWSNQALRPVLMSFLITSPLLSLPIFILRNAGLPPEISYKMYIMSYVTSIIIMPIIWLIGKVYQF